MQNKYQNDNNKIDIKIKDGISKKKEIKKIE